MKPNSLFNIISLIAVVMPLFTLAACGLFGEHVHEWDIKETIIQPTCVSGGIGVKVCIDKSCGAQEEYDLPIDSVLGHQFSDPTIERQPTCTENGWGTKICTLGCGIEPQRHTYKAIGHNLPQTSAPTCTLPGRRAGNCSRCGQYGIQSIPSLGHSWRSYSTVIWSQSYKCSRCGAFSAWNY